MIAPLPFFEDRGSPIRVYEEAKALTKLGFQVDVVCYHLGRDVLGVNKIHRIINIPWYNRITSGPTYHKVYLDMLLFSKAFEVMKDNRFDIIHAHLHEGAAIAQIMKSVFKIEKPVIFDAQGSLVGEMSSHGFIKPSSFMFRFWRIVEKKVCEESAAILASSPQLVEILKRDFDIEKKKIKLIPDGVDINFFNPNRFHEEEIRQKYQLVNNEIIIYTGIFTKHQGLNFLIEEVIPLVVKKYQNAKFLLVGYPVNEYIRLAKKMRVNNNTLFTGKQRYDEIPRFLAAADVAITPKYMETGEANLKILTYMAMGLPTVAFNNTYTRKLLAEGSGLTTRPDDAEEFADAILNLLDNPRRRKAMGQKARSIVENEYSWLSIAKEIGKIYTHLKNGL